ncbi:hypothetical protein C8Q72DRAFT_576648 [Fomitopsis betulina]|nr:hypothetical protein C8Q72DRAFT_576648 [Fomitopsis betulina]
MDQSHPSRDLQQGRRGRRVSPALDLCRPLVAVVMRNDASHVNLGVHPRCASLVLLRSFRLASMVCSGGQPRRNEPQRPCTQHFILSSECHRFRDEDKPGIACVIAAHIVFSLSRTLYPYPDAPSRTGMLAWCLPSDPSARHNRRYTPRLLGGYDATAWLSFRLSTALQIISTHFGPFYIHVAVTLPWLLGRWSSDLNDLTTFD